MDKNRRKAPWYFGGAAGQSLVEYSLIAALVVLALAFALAATGPAIANVFNSSVLAVVGGGPEVNKVTNAPTSFWLTVTWVASQTPAESPFPTNPGTKPPTLAPPDFTPSATFTPSKTFTPAPTSTWTRTPTPAEQSYRLPFEDPAQDQASDTAVKYRLESSADVGQNAWEYEAASVPEGNGPTDLDGAGVIEASGSMPPHTTALLTESTDIENIAESYMAIRYTRDIFIFPPAGERVGFRLLNPNGHVRVKLNGSVIIDQWNNAPAPEVTVYQTLAGGSGDPNGQKYTLEIDYYQDAGNPNLEFEILKTQVNPDDVVNTANCSWGLHEGDRTNTRPFAWNAAEGFDEFPANNTCYLELRGFVELADNGETGYTFTPPAYLSFWNIWDLPADTTVSLQVAPHDGVNRPTGWQNTGWTQSGGKNYEWTQESVNLTGLGFNAGDRVSYRFRIQSGASTDRRRWYVDDIHIKNQNTPDLSLTSGLTEADMFGICTDPDKICDTFWDLEDTAKAEEDFRTTGRWALTSNRSRTGLAWEDDPGFSYSLEEGSGAGDDQRVYYIEFDKRINLPSTSNNGVDFIGLADWEGDTGAPALTFWQSYTIKDNAKLEVQYFDDNTGEWVVLRQIVHTIGGGEFSQSISPYEVDLTRRQVMNANGTATNTFETIPNWWTTPMRVRFAMTVLDEATTSADGIGWTIDDVLIERIGAARFTEYPLYDSAGDGGDIEFEESTKRWLGTGRWQITNESAYGTGQYAFTDSPGADYAPGQNTSLQLRFPIDLNSDTPANPAAQSCVAAQAGGTCEIERQPVAVQPTLSFFWRRDLQTNHRLVVEIARSNAGVISAFETVWEYNYDSSNARQVAWERAEIALYPYITDDAGSNTEDDLVIQFRLDTTGNSSLAADGVFIDDIRVEDANMMEYNLWSTTNGGQSQRFIDTIDDRTFIVGDTSDTPDIDGRWWNRWHLGGSWNGMNPIQSFPAHSGTQVLHDSPPIDPDPFDDSTTYRYEIDSYNVLEMRRVIDLTGVDTASGLDGTPRMYYWWRNDLAEDAWLEVQMSYELPTPPNPAPILTYGDDELYGWSPWITVKRHGQDKNYQWVRAELNLSSLRDEDSNNTYNFSDDRIRVRFVLNANDVANTSDGWFIDDVEFNTSRMREIPLPFIDRAQGLTNFVGEGQWGLDIASFRGGSDAPEFGDGTDSGWEAHYFNCEYRPDPDTALLAIDPRQDCDGSRISNAMLTDIRYRQLAQPVDAYNLGNRWYVEDFIAGDALEIDFGDTGPALAPGNFLWEDNFAAEYRRWISVDQPYRYVFYVRSDDGVRMGVTNMPLTSELRNFPETEEDINLPANVDNYNDPIDAPDRGLIYYNNIIDKWFDQGPTVYQGAVSLVPNSDGTPRGYLLTVQYYERFGSGEIALGISGPNSSFGDSPLLVPTTNTINEPANYLSNTALILNGLLDLRSSNEPIITYYTKYDMRDIDATAYLEVSTDGGFTWTRDNLRNPAVIVPGGFVEANSATSWGGRYGNPGDDNWDLRSNYLGAYKGNLLMVRWRLDVDADRDTVTATYERNNRYADGVNITDINIFDAVQPSAAPQILNNPAQSVVVESGEARSLTVTATGQLPLRYEWFQGVPPDPGSPGTPGTTPAGNVPAPNGSNSPTYTPPDDLAIGTYRFWVRVSNTVSDNEPSVLPAISTATRYSVESCVPDTPGDCGVYRINVNGGDVPTTDGSEPAWMGDCCGGSASSGTYRPNMSGGWTGSDSRIDIEQNGNYFVDAAALGNAPEVLYERWRIANSMTWNLPITNGDYVVRLLLADKDGDRDFARSELRLEGNIARYFDGTGYQNWDNFTPYDEGGNRRAMIFEMEPVTVSDGNLTIDLRRENNDNEKVIVSGIEVFPAPDNAPIIVEQPNDRLAVAGDTITMTVKARSRQAMTIEWFEGTDNTDESNPITTGITTVPDGFEAESFLETTVNGPTAFWAKVTTAGGVVRSDVAFVTMCTEVGEGACNRWYINAGGPRMGAPDGTVWLDDDNDSRPQWRVNGTNGIENEGGNGDWNNYGPGNLGNYDSVPQELFRTRRQCSCDYYWDIGPVDPGTYMVTLYFADNNFNNNGFDNTAKSREANILIEGQTVETEFNLATAVGGQANIVHSETYEVVVVDNYVRIEIDRTGGNPQVSGLKVVPR